MRNFQSLGFINEISEQKIAEIAQHKKSMEKQLQLLQVSVCY
jgi:hypothetical protein